MYNYRLALSILLLLVMLSCKQQQHPQKHSSSISDFRPQLEPLLVSVVSRAYFEHSDSIQKLESVATDNELKLLSVSEHPILRAVAIREMLNRNTFNQEEVIMAHLDDSAMVVYDRGEWGAEFDMVADNMLLNHRWKNEDMLRKVAAEVVLKHCNLKAAYRALRRFKGDKKYYVATRKMVLQKMDFETQESALYALAAYQKPEDRELIVASIKEEQWRWGYDIFGLLREFHCPEYFAELERYYYDGRLSQAFRRNSISTVPFYYLEAVASYKDEKSAELLRRILREYSVMPRRSEVNDFTDRLTYVIWKNNCEAYASLIPAIKHDLFYQDLSRVRYPGDTIPVPHVVQPTPGNFWW